MEFAACSSDRVRKVLDDRISVNPEYVRFDSDDSEYEADEGRNDGKKTIVYFTTISFLAEHSTGAIEKIKRTLTPLISNRLCRQSSRRLIDRIRILYFLILNFCRLLSAVPGSLSGSSPGESNVQQAKLTPAGFANCQGGRYFLLPF